MVEIVREFVVTPEARGRFELAFGPGGAWSKLVAGRPGFRGTTLLCDVADPNRFLIFDLWDGEDACAGFQDEGAAGLRDLEADFDRWTVRRADLGVFRIRAQGTVRPKARGRRGR